MPDMLSRVKFYRLRKQVFFNFIFVRIFTCKVFQICSEVSFVSLSKENTSRHNAWDICCWRLHLTLIEHRLQSCPLLCFLTIVITSLFNYLSSISTDSIEAEYSRTYAGINKFIDSSFYTNTNRWYNLHCWSFADGVLLC